MKNIKPIHVILIGAGITTFLSYVMFIFLYIFSSVTLLQLLIAPLITGIISYFVFQLLVDRFIIVRIRKIYASIRQVENTSSNKKAIHLNNDILSEVQHKTEDWTDDRINEISKLKEQEEFRREFLGNLAHELKTPVFSIQGYILTLLEGGLEDETINRKFLERASKATERMTLLLEDLDSISKMEVNDLSISPKSFDLVELVEESFESVERAAKRKNILLKFNKEYDKTIVFADKHKINQVLINLINNSIYYGNENGNTLITLTKSKDNVLVEVSDDGPGIEAEHLPRLFERFYRVEKSRNRHKGGSGLGLSIVKHILELHNQSFNISSTAGEGTTVSFTLDRKEA